MEIKLIDTENFNIASMDRFRRHQLAEYVYRPVDGELRAVLDPFEEDWSPERRREKAAEILSGSFIVYGAFEDGRVVGEIMLLPELDNGRMIVDSFHVSEDFRRHGIGRALFGTAKEEAKKHGASALYVSACSARETIDFYTAMGCRVSTDPIQFYVDDEPYDIQMECPL